ncbi:Uncharacterised protein [Staphylococcus aureus]|nr:hypothetical protein M1C041_2589 [Staphylococcus aureus]GBU73127.1 hypothetical protein M1C041_2610 [Staphylococcus aureus]CAC5443327.1 Uncharacterised protein [Staphylococcus aureus]SGS59581.1 Uncharacterised protein [Staphylococcus aureus]
MHRVIFQSNIKSIIIDPIIVNILGKVLGSLCDTKVFITFVSSIILLNSSPLSFESKKEVFNRTI